MYCGKYDAILDCIFPIRTECGEIRSNSPYSVRMRETTDQNNSEYGHFLRSAASISFPNRTTTETATDTYMNIY